VVIIIEGSVPQLKNVGVWIVLVLIGGGGEGGMIPPPVAVDMGV
jgi:hypothetical protein